MDMGLYYIVSAAILALIVWKIRNTMQKGKDDAQKVFDREQLEEKTKQLELQLLQEKVLSQEKYDQLQEQDKARILEDWNKVWPMIEQKLIKSSGPTIREYLKANLSSIGTYEAVMNELNWNYLLEGAIPQIPPSGRQQINHTIENLIDIIKQEKLK